MASSPFHTFSQLLQPRITFATTPTNNNNNNLSSCTTRPSNKLLLPPTLSLSSNTQRNDLDFHDRTTRLHIKRHVHKITTLSSTNSKTQILRNLEKDAESFKTSSDFNHLLMALVIAQQHEVCLILFTKLQSFKVLPNGCTFSIVIRCHCERNDPDEAKKVLDTLLQNGFLPDEVTMNVLMSSLCKKGKVQKAREVFEVMREKGFKMSVQSHNCLLKGLCYVGRVEEALDLLNEMKNETPLLNPDVYSYTVVMDGLCKVGLSDEAMGLLNEAVRVGIVPNEVTFNTLIEGYSREGRPLEGVLVLELMKKKHGCVPGYVNYSTVLHGLLKWNEIPAAFKVYKEMVELGIEVDSRMMAKLARRLCRLSRRERGLLRDACQVFEKMTEKGFVVDQRTLEVIFEALLWGEKFDEALEVLNDMVKLGYSPKAIAFDKVIQGFSANGKLEEAVSILLFWLGNGGVPHKFSYEMLIKELNAQGRLICASILLGAAFKQGVVPSMDPLLCKCCEER
ncbi:pentatricopeptide repeat-containing protein At1g62680, mitochondrial-like [Arachis duranensis]|uniref:Pentatricopeptide repeat-containing protein At1g62680, mitochondrial-like n=1 Tax=Arachis duranensis TaxID=130453 RepID=A0A6P4D2G4_ARADU|nr:pentatricopeptide repeat-containing protein At1g62680, mitochondrial-like [Arachis duranensis]